MAGKTFPAFPAHAQPEVLCIWQETHGEWSHVSFMASQITGSMTVRLLSRQTNCAQKSNSHITVCWGNYWPVDSTKASNTCHDVIMPLYALYSSHGNVCHVAIMGPTNRKLSIRFYLHITLPFQCALLPTVPSATIAWLFARLAKQDSSSSMALAKVIDKIVKITKPLFLYFTWFFDFFPDNWSSSFTW